MEKGFVSFLDCYNHYSNKGADLAEVFYIDDSHFERGKAFKAPKQGANTNQLQRNPSLFYILKHMKEYDIY